MVSMHILSGLAFRSPLHARALPNLEGRALKAMRSVALKVGTWWTAYQRFPMCNDFTFYLYRTFVTGYSFV